MKRHDARPTTEKALRYMAQPGFVSSVAIGGTAPDGAAYLLDGTASTLHGLLGADCVTVLNFGSCT